MKKIIVTATLAALLLVICGLQGYAQKKSVVDKHASGEDIYKHYTGTVGTKKIALDLRWGYQGGSNYGGSSYYSPGEDKITKITLSQPRSFDHGVPLSGNEEAGDTSIAGNERNDRLHLAKWNFTISDDKLTGKWHSADGKEILDINLVEDYSKSMALDLKVTEDTCVQRVPDSEKPLARTILIYVAPRPNATGKSVKLLQECILKITGMAAKGVKDLSKLRVEYNRHFTAECEKSLAAIKESGKTPNQNQKMTFVMPVYNDNGLLVLENNDNVWTQGGFKGTYSYLCLDFQNNHIYNTGEMLNANNPKLPSLLEAELRKKYNLDAGKPLTTWLKKDAMSVSDNFYPVRNGIVFVYTSDELVDGKKLPISTFTTKISVYLSYAALGDALRPGFKKRVGL